MQGYSQDTVSPLSGARAVEVLARRRYFGEDEAGKQLRAFVGGKSMRWVAFIKDTAARVGNRRFHTVPLIRRDPS